MEGVGVIEFFLTQVTLVTKGVKPVGWKDSAFQTRDT